MLNIAAVLLALTPCVWASESSQFIVLENNQAKEEMRVVTKVVTLLQDMLKTLDKEGKEDQETWEKMDCWCDTNEKIKTKAIADAEAKIAELAANIEEYKATLTTLKTEIRRIEETIAEDQQALYAATTLREKEQAEFNAEEKDLVSSIGALKVAVVILEKHSLSFIQKDSEHFKAVAANLQKVMVKHAHILKKAISGSQQEFLASFIQVAQPDGSPSTHSSFLESSGPYDHQSGTIFGIISQMKESFEINLANAQKDELEKSKAFQELKEAKEAQIKAGKKKRFTKRQLQADLSEKLEEAKTDKRLTEETKFADEQFLAALKKKCKRVEEEWQDRQKTRAEEVAAVSDALNVLNTDEAHDLFNKALKPSFIQKQSITNSKQLKKQQRQQRKKGDRDEASTLLSDVAQRVHNPRLATLATRVRLDDFTEIKKDIDEMVAELKTQSADEIKLKDSCNTMFNENAAKTEDKTREKVATEQEMSDLEAKIASLTQLIKDLNDQVKELQTERTIASNTRNYEHADFYHTVDDERAAQGLLEAAYKILAKFYIRSKAKFVTLAQQGHDQKPPPPEFEEYDMDKAHENGVLKLIKKIIDDANKVENEALLAEADAQRAYEDFLKESNLAIDARRKALEEAKETKAKKQAELVLAKEENRAQIADLESLASVKSDLHARCDYVLKNFDIRQKARGEEIESLIKAKQILSGAKMFLQLKKRQQAIA